MIKNTLKFAVAALVSCFFIYLLRNEVSVEAFLITASAIPIKTLVLVIFFSVSAQCLKALRWCLIVENQSSSISIEHVLTFVWTNSLNAFVPLRGGDLLRVWCYRNQLSWVSCGAKIILEKCLDLALVLMLFASSLFFYKADIHFIYFVIWIIFFVFVLGRISVRVIDYTGSHMLTKILSRIDVDRKNVVPIVFLSLATWIFEISAIFLFVQGLSTISVLEAIQLNGVVALSGLILSLPSGIGVFHFAVGTFSHFFSISSDGFSLAGALHITLLCSYAIQLTISTILSHKIIRTIFANSRSKK